MIVLLGVLVCIGLVFYRASIRAAGRTLAATVHEHAPGRRTVDDRVQEFGPAVRQRLEPAFRRQNVPYPPAKLTFIALKAEKSLEVYASGADGRFRWIRSYPILAASGRAGPKLREGDGQVPEGLYRIESLNPNSLFHVSLRINYPNELDRSHAAAEHRDNLGGDIMIHGSNVSIGCLAMGDQTAEDLFVLAALTGVGNIRVILSPQDLRVEPAPAVPADVPTWLRSVYAAVAAEMQRYPEPDPAPPEAL